MDVLGLKTAFALLMGRGSKKKNPKATEEDEQRAVSIVYSLFNCVLRGSRRERLEAKLVESEYEKVYACHYL